MREVKIRLEVVVDEGRRSPGGGAKLEIYNFSQSPRVQQI